MEFAMLRSLTSIPTAVFAKNCALYLEVEDLKSLAMASLNRKLRSWLKEMFQDICYPSHEFYDYSEVEFFARFGLKVHDISLGYSTQAANFRSVGRLLGSASKADLHGLDVLEKKDFWELFPQRGPCNNSLSVLHLTAEHPHLLRLSQNCPNLKELEITSCDHTVDKHWDCLRNLRSLETLRLSNFSSLSPSLLERILQNCPALTALDISEYHEASDSLAEVVARNCGARLRELHFENNRNYSEQAVIYLGASCPNLIKLWIRNCGCGDRSMQALEGCPHLTHLYAPSNENVTDSGFLALLANCKQLEVLDLNGSPELTDISLSAISRCVPNLRVFHTTGEFTEEALISFASNCQSLREFSVVAYRELVEPFIAARPYFHPDCKAKAYKGFERDDFSDGSIELYDEYMQALGEEEEVDFDFQDAWLHYATGGSWHDDYDDFDEVDEFDHDIDILDDGPAY